MRVLVPAFATPAALALIAGACSDRLTEVGEDEPVSLSVLSTRALLTEALELPLYWTPVSDVVAARHNHI